MIEKYEGWARGDLEAERERLADRARQARQICDGLDDEIEQVEVLIDERREPRNRTRIPIPPAPKEKQCGYGWTDSRGDHSCYLSKDHEDISFHIAEEGPPHAWLRMDVDIKLDPEAKPRVKLEEEIEQLHVQLAGCGVAAQGVRGESDAKQGDYGWSASYEAVKQLRKEVEKLRISESKRTVEGAVDLLKERDELREEVKKLRNSPSLTVLNCGRAVSFKIDDGSPMFSGWVRKIDMERPDNFSYNGARTVRLELVMKPEEEKHQEPWYGEDKNKPCRLCLELQEHTKEEHSAALEEHVAALALADGLRVCTTCGTLALLVEGFCSHDCRKTWKMIPKHVQDTVAKSRAMENRARAYGIIRREGEDLLDLELRLARVLKPEEDWPR